MVAISASSALCSAIIVFLLARTCLSRAMSGIRVGEGRGMGWGERCCRGRWRGRWRGWLMCKFFCEFWVNRVGVC